jgi:hypothetical protein
MIVDIALYNKALDDVFKDGTKTYKIRLVVNTGLYENTVTFTTASGGATQLPSSTFFAIPSGTTVSGVQVNADVILGTKTLDTPVAFTSNGTFTVSNVVISLTNG